MCLVCAGLKLDLQQVCLFKEGFFKEGSASLMKVFLRKVFRFFRAPFKPVFQFNCIAPKRIVFLCFLSSGTNDFDTKENTTERSHTTEVENRL